MVGDGETFLAGTGWGGFLFVRRLLGQTIGMGGGMLLGLMEGGAA